MEVGAHGATGVVLHAGRVHAPAFTAGAHVVRQRRCPSAPPPTGTGRRRPRARDAVPASLTIETPQGGRNGATMQRAINAFKSIEGLQNAHTRSCAYSTTPGAMASADDATAHSPAQCDLTKHVVAANDAKRNKQWTLQLAHLQTLLLHTHPSDAKWGKLRAAERKAQHRSEHWVHPAAQGDPPLLPRDAPPTVHSLQRDVAHLQWVCHVPNCDGADAAPRPAAWSLPGRFYVPHSTFTQLRPHQREGVAWLWSLHPRSASAAPVHTRIGSPMRDAALETLREHMATPLLQAEGLWSTECDGGVVPPHPAAPDPALEHTHSTSAAAVRAVGGGCLADDMGMGKTVQVAVFLAALYGSGATCRAALVVAPSSIVAVWERELKAWAPCVPVHTLSGSAAAQAAALSQVQTGAGGVLLCTPGRLRSQAARLADATWEAVVLDEAHAMKNPRAQVTRAAAALPAQVKVALTGTPLQNNPMELHCVMRVVCGEALLGSAARFSSTCSLPLLQAQDGNADMHTRLHGELAAALLQERLSAHFLRRVKGDLPQGGDCDTALQLPPPPKTELVAWCAFTPEQLRVYEWMLPAGGAAMCAACGTPPGVPPGPLMRLHALRQLARHPLLMKRSTWQHAVDAATLSDNGREGGVTEPGGAADGAAAPQEEAPATPTPSHTDAALPPHDVLQLLCDGSTPTHAHAVHLSGKLQVATELLALFQRERRSALLFSDSLGMLDAVQAQCSRRGIPCSRIDGSVVGEDRAAVVQRFQRDAGGTPQVCLLSKGVGAMGLTLTAATRIVIMEPAWNPAVDAQAVDRAHRMGQQQRVVTYRCVTTGSVEEVQYRAQMFKAGVAKAAVTAAGCSVGAVSKEEMKGVFTLGCTRTPDTFAAAAARGWTHSRVQDALHQWPQCVQEHARNVLGVLRDGRTPLLEVSVHGVVEGGSDAAAAEGGEQ